MPIVAIDTFVSHGAVSGNRNVSHTCNGPNRLLVVNASIRNLPDDITGMTYDSVSLTQLVNVTIDSGPSESRHYIFYLIDPSSGSNTLAVTASGLPYALDTISLTGVHQVSPVGDQCSSVGDGTSRSCTISGVNTNGWITAILTEVPDQQAAACSRHSPAGDTTERACTAWGTGGGSRCMNTGEEEADVSEVIEWNTTTLSDCRIDAVEWLPAVGGGQIIIMMSKVRDFYRDLKRGIIRPDELRRRYGELAQI